MSHRRHSDDPEHLPHRHDVSDLPMFAKPPLLGPTPSAKVDTSEQAAHSAEAFAGKQALQVLNYLIAYGPQTCDALEEALGLRHQSAAARLWQLERSGHVRKTADTKLTRSGRRARLYEVLRADECPAPRNDVQQDGAA